MAVKCSSKSSNQTDGEAGLEWSGKTSSRQTYPVNPVKILKLGILKYDRHTREFGMQKSYLSPHGAIQLDMWHTRYTMSCIRIHFIELQWFRSVLGLVHHAREFAYTNLRAQSYLRIPAFTGSNLSCLKLHNPLVLRSCYVFEINILG